MLNQIGLLIVSLLTSFTIHAEITGQYFESTDLAVGTSHACAMTTAGLKCFGNAEEVILKIPANAKKISQIQSGNRFNCMITEKGIRCWGEIPGQSKSDITIGPRVLKNPKLLSVGYDHACAVSATDVIKCWGKNEQGESTPPKKLKNISELSLGMTNSCVIADKKVVCWGIASTGSIAVPENISNPHNLTSGWWHHCVESDDGLKCWGHPFKDSVAPDDPTLKGVVSGGMLNCGLSDSGVKCWDETGKTTLLVGSETTKTLKMGSSLICAITDAHGVMCWKNDKPGIYKKRVKSFVPAGGIASIDKISAGNSSTCAYGDGDIVKCWGSNPDGALDVPEQIEGPITAFSLGARRLCTLTKNGVGCFGNGNTDYDVPKKLEDITMVSSGGYQICAGNKDKINCWGDDIRDALSVPKNLTNISQISSGFTHACAIANGTVNCWGGTGLISGVNPSKKMTNPKAVCAGGTFSCGIGDGGKVSCWGKKIPLDDDMGKELYGVNTNAVLNVPRGISQAVEISCGLSHACAIYKGQVKCWGDAGLTGAKLIPRLTIKNPRMLTAGWNHTCALGDGGLSCWGDSHNLEMPKYSLEK